MICSKPSFLASIWEKNSVTVLPTASRALLPISLSFNVPLIAALKMSVVARVISLPTLTVTSPSLSIWILAFSASRLLISISPGTRLMSAFCKARFLSSLSFIRFSNCSRAASFSNPDTLRRSTSRSASFCFKLNSSSILLLVSSLIVFPASSDSLRNFWRSAKSLSACEAWSRAIVSSRRILNSFAPSSPSFLTASELVILAIL